MKQVTSQETDFGAKFFFMNETEIFHDQNDSNLSRQKRIQEERGFDPITGRYGRITYCNGVNACGDPNFVASICGKSSCGTMFCQLIRRGNVESPGQLPSKEPGKKAPFVSWNHIIKEGFWCMACCILDENVHPKMKVWSSMERQDDIFKEQDAHGP